MSKSPTLSDKKKVLAREIAIAFKEENKVELYEYIFEKYDISRIQKVYDQVKLVPDDKIKKSRSALFFYLLYKYVE